jgi:transposase
LHRAGELVSVRIPTVQEEAVRDLCRTRADMVEDLTRARNRLGKFLLRHGRVWRGGSTWTLKHQAWLGSQRFEQPAMAQTFGHYLAVVEVRNTHLDAVEADLAGWCDRPPFDWQVARLAAYRGVTRLGALTLAAEVADWRRFATASQFMGFCGLPPKRAAPAAPASTAARSPRPATPTCAPSWPGSAWALKHRPAVGVRIARRQQGLPPAVAARAWKAQQRLCARFRILAARKNLREHRGGRDRPGARRVLMGRDDRLTTVPAHRRRLEIGRGGPPSVRRAGTPPLQDRSPNRRCRGLRPATVARGTFLPMADVRSQPATISVAASRSPLTRRVVPP